MRAAQAIQESFGLRSTVAALGFAIRTVAQLLEEGQEVRPVDRNNRPIEPGRQE